MLYCSMYSFSACLSIQLQELVLLASNCIARNSLKSYSPHFPIDKARCLQVTVDYINIFDSMKQPRLDMVGALRVAAVSLSNFCTSPTELLMLRGYLQRLLRMATEREIVSESDALLACTAEARLRRLGTVIAHVTTECQFCGEEPGKAAITLQRCSRCMEVTYCSKGCQKAHWNLHKSECKKF